MQTSRFQLGLIAVLAMGFGFSLSSSDAIGYPAGAAVSMGTNPLWTFGKRISGGPTHAAFTAPDDRDMVLTDLSLSVEYDYDAAVSLTLSDGTELGVWFVNGSRSSSHTASSVNMSMTSGIRIPSGLTLIIAPPVDVAYSFSGYYAQP